MNDIVVTTGSTASAAADVVATPEKPRSGSGVTIAKNSMWLMVESLGSIVFAFYSSILVARRLGPEIMGGFNYILYFATVLRMVTEVAIPATVRKFAAEYSGRGDYTMVKTLVSRIFRLQWKLIVVGLAAGLALVHGLFPRDQRLVATIAVLSTVPAMLQSTPSGALWATENLRYNVVSSLCGSIVNIVGVTAAVFLHWGLAGLVTSLLVSRLVDCSLRYAIFRRLYARLPGEARPNLDPEIRARVIRFASHQLVLVLLYSLLFDRMEVFFLHRLASTREIAFFSISFSLVQYLLLVPQNLASSASVSMWVNQGRSSEEAARMAATTTWFIMILAAPELFGVAAISDPLLRLLYGAKYLTAIPVLTVLALFGLCLTVSQPAQYMLVGAERQRFYIIWLSASGLIDVVGNLLLIPHLGALGAAYAKGVSQLIGGIGFLVYLVVVFRSKLPLWRMAKVLVACGAMFAAVRLVNSRPFPPLLALLIGIPVGAVVFLSCARALRCLDGADADRLRQLKRALPAVARGSYLRIVSFLVPS